MSENVLRLDHVTMQFGGVVAVNDLSMEVNDKEIVALIGPNGAGKTTAFNCITGVYEPTNGMVSFMGKTMVCNHRDNWATRISQLVIRKKRKPPLIAIGTIVPLWHRNNSCYTFTYERSPDPHGIW